MSYPYTVSRLPKSWLKDQPIIAEELNEQHRVGYVLANRIVVDRTTGILYIHKKTIINLRRLVDSTKYLTIYYSIAHDQNHPLTVAGVGPYMKFIPFFSVPNSEHYIQLSIENSSEIARMFREAKPLPNQTSSDLLATSSEASDKRLTNV